jgi:hypothetical protein
MIIRKNLIKSWDKWRTTCFFFNNYHLLHHVFVKFGGSKYMVHGNYNRENFTFFPQNVPTLGHLFPRKIFCKKTILCVFYNTKLYVIMKFQKYEINIITIFCSILFKMSVWIYFDILKVQIFWNSCNVFAIEVKSITKSMESIKIEIFNII